LCTHLLTRAGADVVKIETGDRPDGARRGDPAFFDLLHAGQRAVTVDLDSDALGRLIAAADLVIEGSRPRALRQLGVVAEDVVAAGTSWLSITAYGRGPTDELRVGFGDDVAAGAGLVGWDGGMPVPAADALADPLAGVYAAAAAAAALAAPRAYLLDVSMHDTARLAAGIYEIEPARNDASVEPQAPRGRQPAGRAPRVGEHNPDLLAPSH
jgi:crotonobetainyl-CoA:carnitine CoA-transferase CaiB-like acyl-CoA transferase